MHASNSAAGLDGWLPQDAKLLPLGAYKVLASMLNTIEQGAPWPSEMLCGRLAFLAKDPANADAPLAYRPVLIMPHFYRRWAADKLHGLSGWRKRWATPEKFAGVPVQGDGDAW